MQRVVLISSVGAQHESGVGPIACLPAGDRGGVQCRCPQFGLSSRRLVPENFLNHVSSIASSGTIFGPHPAAKKIPMVATRDIATKAVALLRDEHWEGHRIVGVHRPEDLDQIQAARIIGEGLNRPVRYVEVSVDQAKPGMAQAGMPGFIVDLLGEMYTGFREGRMERAEARTPETTTPTTLLEFSLQVLKPAVDAVAMSQRKQA